MKIGLDLDGVVFDSEKYFRVYAELYDILELHQNGIIDNREVRFQERYNWDKKTIDSFMNKYMFKIIKKCNLVPGAKEVIKLLKDEGHELIIITARGGITQGSEYIKLTEDILKNNDMYIFDKYIWAADSKCEACVNEKLDIMIEDSDKNCKLISDKKIRTLYFKDAPNFEVQENEYLKTVYNWGEIYRYIQEVCNEYRNS